MNNDRCTVDGATGWHGWRIDSTAEALHSLWHRPVLPWARFLAGLTPAELDEAYDAVPPEGRAVLHAGHDRLKVLLALRPLAGDDDDGQLFEHLLRVVQAQGTGGLDDADEGLAMLWRTRGWLTSWVLIQAC